MNANQVNKLLSEKHLLVLILRIHDVLQKSILIKLVEIKSRMN